MDHNHEELTNKLLNNKRKRTTWIILLAAWLTRSSWLWCRRPPRSCRAPTGLARARCSAAASPAEVHSPCETSACCFAAAGPQRCESLAGCARVRHEALHTRLLSACHPPRRHGALVVVGPSAWTCWSCSDSTSRALRWERWSWSWGRIGPLGRRLGAREGGIVSFLGRRREAGWLGCYYVSFFDFWIYTHVIYYMYKFFLPK